MRAKGLAMAIGMGLLLGLGSTVAAECEADHAADGKAGLVVQDQGTGAAKVEVVRDQRAAGGKVEVVVTGAPGQSVSVVAPADHAVSAVGGNGAAGAPGKPGAAGQPGR
jgi:hypothetical protein